jgi:uncharacterized protein YndB with AHSA1/START domain
MNLQIDPKLDLVLDRVVDVSPKQVWAAWTNPEHLKKWFTPHPWQTVDCEIDLRPGGLFRTVMRSPEGEDQPPNIGCYLEVVENERVTWTSVLGSGFRPLPAASEPGCHGLQFTATIHLFPHGDGTRYVAVVRHASEETRRSHEEMGFHEGWSTVLDQLVALIKG